MKLSIVIPAYNESESVAHTAEKLRPVLDQLGVTYAVEVVFVDDGSKDDTVAKLKAEFEGDSRVQVVPHPQNQGPGAAIRTGFASATGDIVVTTDFDGTYRFENIPVIVEQLERDSVDVVTASPYHPQGGVEGVPRYRLLFSIGASTLYRILVSWKVHTWTSFFRAYRREVVKSVYFESSGFLAVTEILVNALRMGFRVSEFPTVLHRRAFGQSSLKIARTTWAHLKFQARILLRRAPLHPPERA